MRQVLQIFADAFGQPLKIQTMPKPLMSVLGLFNGDMRELKEMLYQWERPFHVDGSKFAARFSFDDEFAIALPNATAESALILLEEIRGHLAERPVEGWTIEATFGVAARPPHAVDISELYRCADAALARGKRERRPGGDQRRGEDGVLKSNYYSRASLSRLSKLADRLNRTEASLLREALDDLLRKLR